MDIAEWLHVAIFGYLIYSFPKIIDASVSSYYAYRLECKKADLTNAANQSKIKFEQQYISKKIAYDAIWLAATKIQEELFESKLVNDELVAVLDRSIRIHRPFICQDVLMALAEIDPLLNDGHAVSLSKLDEIIERVAKSIQFDLFGGS